MESEKNLKEEENRAKLANNSGRRKDDNDKEPKSILTQMFERKQ